MQASHKLAEEIYKTSAAKAQGAKGAKPEEASSGAGKQPGQDDVVDADFKVEDEKK